MTVETTTPTSTASSERTSTRISRKQFNSFLYDLYECKGPNNVTADAAYELGAFYVEVFLNSPAGLMIALHHDDFQTVDLLQPATDTTVSEQEVV